MYTMYNMLALVQRRSQAAQPHDMAMQCTLQPLQLLRRDDAPSSDWQVLVLGRPIGPMGSP